MVPQKHLAVSANTTRVFSPEHRGICTALRCEANTSAFLPKGKHPSPPSLWHKETVSDKEADTPLGRALQNECATRPCVAERHTAVRSACWSLTPAAREFAAAKTRTVAINLNMPNPFFALALGLCTQANCHQEEWGQAPLRSTLRDSIARE